MLNLFNYVLALFRTKFACNLAIRYPVFKCELCKGNVWESVKKSEKVCNSRESCDWISRLAIMAHVWNMQREQKGHASCSTIGKNFQFGRAVSSRLKLTTRSSRKLKSPKWLVWLKLTLRIPHTPHYKYSYTHEI